MTDTRRSGVPGHSRFVPIVGRPRDEGRSVRTVSHIKSESCFRDGSAPPVHHETYETLALRTAIDIKTGKRSVVCVPRRGCVADIGICVGFEPQGLYLRSLRPRLLGCNRGNGLSLLLDRHIGRSRRGLHRQIRRTNGVLCDCKEERDKCE